MSWDHPLDHPAGHPAALTRVSLSCPWWPGSKPSQAGTDPLCGGQGGPIRLRHLGAGGSR